MTRNKKEGKSKWFVYREIYGARKEVVGSEGVVRMDEGGREREQEEIERETFVYEQHYKSQPVALTPCSTCDHEVREFLSAARPGPLSVPP